MPQGTHPPKKNAKRTRRHGQGGFTLIELMISLLVLAFGLLGVASAQITALRGGQNGRHLSQAAALAQEELEFVQRATWTQVPIGTVVRTVNNTVNAPIDMVENTYTVTRVVTAATAGRLRQIDVRVSWEDPKRGTRTFTLSGMRFNWEG